MGRLIAERILRNSEKTGAKLGIRWNCIWDVSVCKQNTTQPISSTWNLPYSKYLVSGQKFSGFTWEQTEEYSRKRDRFSLVEWKTSVDVGESRQQGVGAV